MDRVAKIVLGCFPTYSEAEEAVDRLRLSGFRNTDVSALFNGDLRAEAEFLGCGLGCVLGWAAGPAIPTQEAAEHREWVAGGGIVVRVRCKDADWQRRAEHVMGGKLAMASAC